MQGPYREEGGVSLARWVRFSSLQPATRRALAEACGGVGALCVLRRRSFRIPPWLLEVLFALGFTSLCVGMFLVMKPLGSARADAAAVASLAFGLFAFTAPILRLIQIELASRLPFDAGVFVFARDLVDARSEVLHILSLDDLRKVIPSRGGVILEFGSGHVHEFPQAPGLADEVALQLAALRARADEAEARGDLAALGAIDPFYREREGWASAPRDAPRPTVKVGGLAALAAASLLLSLATVAGTRGALFYDMALRHDTARLSRLAQGGGLRAREADRQWLRAALETEDLGSLLHYSMVGAKKREAREAFDRLTGGDCKQGSEAQQMKCWLAVRYTCRRAGAADLSLVERSLPFVRNPSVPGGINDWPSGLADVLEGCKSPAVVGLLIEDASREPELVEELRGMTVDPALPAEHRELAARRLREAYDRALAALPAGDAGELKRRLLLLGRGSSRRVSLNVLPRLVEARGQPTVADFPSSEVEVALAVARLQVFSHASPLLGLRPHSPPGPRLTIEVWFSHEQGQFRVHHVSRKLSVFGEPFSDERPLDLGTFPPLSRANWWSHEVSQALAEAML